MASMLELALRYARQGIRVAPMRPENKRPFTEHGIKDATTDEDLIRFWWRKWPYAWPGLAMGGEAGVFTLDVDVKNGVDGWATLTALGVIIEQSTPRIRTPSGGTHLIFKQPPFPISNSAGKLGPGLDIRTTGGYIIAAGSETAEGVRYEFMVGSYLDAPEAPAKLLELLKPPPRKEPPAWEPRARAWLIGRLNPRLPSGHRKPRHCRSCSMTSEPHPWSFKWACPRRTPFRSSCGRGSSPARPARRQRRP